MLWARPAVLVAVGALAFLTPACAQAQGAPREWLKMLETVAPGADRYSDRRGEPPVFEAYRRDSTTGRETLAGYAFLTSDLPPEEKGFNGPIEVLVGMDLGGVLTGIVVTGYDESLRRSRGDFLATPGFQEQFTGKSILDAFQVRRDVDGITGATITVDAMSRGIRNAARKVALAYNLASVSTAAESPLVDPVSVTLVELERMSWTEMLLRGLAQQILVLDDQRTAADLNLVYLRDEAVAEVLLGPSTFEEVLERAGPLARERLLVLAAVDGPLAGAINLARLSIVQDADTVGLEPGDVLLFGPPREGKLDGEVRFLRVLLFEPDVDVARPFTFVLDLSPRLGVFTAEYPGDRPVAARSPGGSMRAASSDANAHDSSPMLVESFAPSRADGSAGDLGPKPGRGAPLGTAAALALLLSLVATVALMRRGR